MRKYAKAEEEAEINMTPMLDIVFIMLIFFIVTASFVKKEGLDLTKPDENQQQQEPPDPTKENVIFKVDNQGLITHKLRRIDVSSVSSIVQQGRASNPDAVAIIQFCPDTKVGVVTEIWDNAAHVVGIDSVVQLEDQRCR